jgi:glycine/D-amino acid oxidase-like deaminating enzyme
VESFEVGIIGAGVHGAAAAHHLARRGVATVVVDRGVPAGGPTGRSSAVCRAFYTNAFLAGMARDSIDMLAHFEDVVPGGYSGFRRTGCLFLHAEEDRAGVERAAEMLNGIGVGVEVLAASDLDGDFAQIDRRGVGVAVWEPGGGYADPTGTTTGLLDAAVNAGARRRLGHAVARIEPMAGGGAILHLDDATRLRCRRLLVAAGPWTAGLVAPLGVALPTTVERHIVACFRWTTATRVPYVVADLPLGYYAKPEGAELICIGHLSPGRRVHADDIVDAVSDDEVAAVGDGLLTRVPALGDLAVQSAWASMYDVSPDWQPVIGEVADGIVVHTGSSGHGFKLAPALGRHVAALLIGEMLDDRIMQFHPDRFAAGTLLAAGFGEVRIIG